MDPTLCIILSLHSITIAIPHRIIDPLNPCKTSNWSIRKRFSDFVTFNSNLIAELKGLDPGNKAIKIPNLPRKTFTKSFSPSFVSSRHDALLSYLNKIIAIKPLSSSVTLLTFLGAVSNQSNDRFLESRMTASVYISNYADTGDVILFETKSMIAASLRSVTASNYDHVALVYRDLKGTHHPMDDEQDRLNGLYLVESTIDGVRTYPLKKRLKQWSVLCPVIVVRRLKVLKPGIKPQFEREDSSSSLNSALRNAVRRKKRIESMFTKYDYATKNNAFYENATRFVEKVNGLDYAIWTPLLKNDVPFEEQKAFFCSQLVTAFFKFMGYLPENIKSNRILPGHFSDDEVNDSKLPLKDCILTSETLLLPSSKIPAVSKSMQLRASHR